MSAKPLTVQIDEMIASGRVHLPVYPAVAEQVATLLARGTPAPEELSQVISHDPVLACNLFRAANSAFYQGLPKVLTIDEAIIRIGVERTAQEIARACRDGQQCPQEQFIPRYFSALWRHALGCALGARWLAHRCGFQSLADQAHLQGLLHDIGKLFLLAALEQIAGNGEAAAFNYQLVEEVVQRMHVEVGLQLVAQWHLPDEFTGVVGRHHETELDGQELVLALVKLANNGCRKVGLGWEKDAELVLPTTAEAQFLGIDEISLAEYEIMLEDRFQLTAPDPA